MKHWKTGLLPLRLAIASIYLYHGLPKALDWAMAADKFAAMGFPGFLGPIVGITEVVAALMLMSGLAYRWANAALGGIIAVAIVGVQLPASIEAGKLIAGLERDALMLMGHVAIAWPLLYRRAASVGRERSPVSRETETPARASL
jgi:putative oxidoreductase